MKRISILAILFMSIFIGKFVYANGIEIDGMYYIDNNSYPSSNEMNNGYVTYSIDEQTQEITLVSVHNDTLTEYEVPSTIEGCIVTKIGKSAFSNCNKIEKVILPPTITQIKYEAFYGCANLREINLPQSLKEIGYGAFSYCNRLEEIIIPNEKIEIGSMAFSNCENLKKVTIPANPNFEQWAFSRSGVESVTFEEGRTTIPSYMFSDCEKLNKINFARTITNIGYYSFSNCSNLKEIIIPKQIESSNNAFSGSGLEKVTIEDGTKEIASGVCRECENLKSVIIPTSVRTIKESAFNDCKILENIILPQSTISIQDFAFHGCSKLKTINLPSKLTEIGYGAFSECINLESIEIPKNVKSLSETFYKCTNLKKVTLPSSLTSIGSNTFENCKSLSEISIPSSVKRIGSDAFKNCIGLRNIKLPNKLYEIESSAFEGCESLLSIEIPNSTRYLENRVFYNCTNLENIKMSAVWSIGEKTFYNCQKLKNMIILKGTKNIGNLAFCNCQSLSSVTIPKSVTEIVDSAFDECPNISFKVIKNSVAEKFAKENSIPYTSSLSSILDCEFSEIYSKIYSGSQIKQNITVYEEEIKLQEGKDYIVTYKNNTKVGKANVIISGKGNYTGTKNLYFEILPSAVRNLKVKAQKEKEISIVWSKNVGNITGYKIYKYEPNNTRYQCLGSTSGTSFTIKKLKDATAYQFFVCAYAKIDNKEYLGERLELLLATTAPRSTKIKSLSTKSKKVTVKWNKVSRANGYEIYMSTSKNGKYKKMGTISKANTTKYTKSNFKKNKKYYFKVRAYRLFNGKKIYGAYSSIKNVKVK